MIVGVGNCRWLEDSRATSSEMCERTNTRTLPETPNLANDEISVQLWSDPTQTSVLSSRHLFVTEAGKFEGVQRITTMIRVLEGSRGMRKD